MKVLILGGAGLMAEVTERELLADNGISKITVADRHPAGVNARVEALDSPKVAGEIVDIFNHDALVGLMKKHDIVVNEASTETNLAAAKAALEAKVHIISLLGLVAPSAPGAPTDEFGQLKDEFLDQMDKDFKDAGLIGIMGLGSMPGTGHVLGRYLGDKFDTIESMEFSYVYAFLGGTKTLFPFDPRGMIFQYTASPLVLRDGKLTFLPPRSGREMVQYPEPIGVTEVFYIYHGEASTFYKHYKNKGIKNAGTKSGWGAEFISKMAFLDSVGLLDMKPRKVGQVSVAPVDVFLSGLYKEGVEKVEKEAKTRDYGCSRLKIAGTIAGEKLEYIADVLSVPYKNYGVTQHRTGVPPVIGVQMIRKGEITQKGCYTADYGIDPKIYFSELTQRGFEPPLYTVRHLI